MRYVKSPVFWGGAAVGFFVGPLVAKMVRMQLVRVRGAAAGG